VLVGKGFSYFVAGQPMILSMDSEIQDTINESKVDYTVASEDAMNWWTLL